MQSSLVGSIFERSSSSTPRAPTTSNQSGFPLAQHRSKAKSAFARRREEESKAAGSSSRPQQVPVVVPHPQSTQPPGNEEEDDWRSDVSRQNEIRVANMTDEEREQEMRDIMQHFGPGVGDILRKARESRESTKRKRNSAETANERPVYPTSDISLPEVPLTLEVPARTGNTISPPLASVPPGSLSATSTRPSTPTRSSRKLRFAQVSPQDVHVYESAPPSPRKKSLLALPPPPPPGSDNDIVSLGSYTPKGVDPEEGTPEYIRRRYFPSAPAANPDLAWMASSIASEKASTDASPLDELRFDLSGNLIPASQSLTLPTHLGLHHHAEGTHAGYTIDDVFMLARSTVTAQRSAMLGILVGLAKWLRDGCPGAEDAIPKAKILPLLKRILFAGLEALLERGSVGARGIDVAWQCLVGWEATEISSLDVPLNEIDLRFGEVELNLPGSTTSAPEASVSALVDSLPLDTVLPQLTPLVSSPPDIGTTESERTLTSNQHQLLAIVHRLAKHSTAAAESIVQTPRLVAGLVNTFLLRAESPTPSALNCLTTLIVASRTNAKALCDPADALLKFVAIYPPVTDLLVGTLRVYTALARYGLYSHCATDAQELWMPLWRASDERVLEAWVGLVEAWIICATDPHRTTPDHDILWSRVVGWGWGQDLLGLNQLSEHSQAAIWRGISAWLEGVRVNGVKGGEAERETAFKVLQPSFAEPMGNGRVVLASVLTRLKEALMDLRNSSSPSLRTLLATSEDASVLTSALRLSIACSSEIDFPIPQISELCASIVSHPLWSLPRQPGLAGLYAGVLCRPFSSLLAYYLRFARTVPGSSTDSWLAQAFVILPRLRVGDEDIAVDIISEVTKIMDENWAKQRGLVVPPVIWERGGLGVLLPIFRHVVQPEEDVRVAPFVVTPRSILESTTARLPTTVLLTTEWHPEGLPLHREWMLAPIDHVLRSGHNASVFKRKGAFPDDWDTSETEIVRASLLLANFGSEVVKRFASALVGEACIGRSEAVLGCMKVFMLEHAQDHDKGEGEVFRDEAVGGLMERLMAQAGRREGEESLEDAAVRFLRRTTPFFQYYTDFVALYDAISFAHPLFTRLLLPPTSMRYAVDYRKHLWVDYGHLIRTIRVKVDVGDMKEYLYPVEGNQEMIGAYVKALVSGAASEGFTHDVALHHVACNVWQRHGSGSEAVAKRLFNLVAQGTADVVREVSVYELSDDVEERLACVKRWCGGDVAERMRLLYAAQ